MVAVYDSMIATSSSVKGLRNSIVFMKDTRLFLPQHKPARVQICRAMCGTMRRIASMTKPVSLMKCHHLAMTGENYIAGSRQLYTVPFLSSECCKQPYAMNHAIIEPSRASHRKSMMRPPSTAESGSSNIKGRYVFVQAEALTHRPCMKM